MPLAALARAGFLIDPLFHLLAESGFRRAAVMRLEFVAVENRRIVAGRNHDAAGGLVVLTAKEIDGVGAAQFERTTGKSFPAKISATRRAN